MIEYTHVRAKVDVYDQSNDLICFAGDIYPITYIDVENNLYHVQVEPEVGGYTRTIALQFYDPDFYFLEVEYSEVVEEIIEEEW